jgi:hypothetical protein
MLPPLSDRRGAAGRTTRALVLVVALLAAAQPSSAQEGDAAGLQIAAARHLLLTADTLPEAGMPSPKALLARAGGKVSIAASGSQHHLDPTDPSPHTRRTYLIADSLRAGGLEVEVHATQREFPDRSPPRREDGTSFITLEGAHIVTCRWTYASGTTCAWDPQADVGLLLGIQEVRFLDGGANVFVSVIGRDHGGEPTRIRSLMVRMEPEAGEWVVRAVRENTIFF